ncbi:FAD-dependent oxidoreductase [Haloglomus litoreum]|uniref:FAD-dependent oxidoreductase n=1 Tax=Haloglomus litoreum TaxID=3034026 RepID=UPI0023E7EC57|nr:FAD-dependent oxidoreductase [Haloglomus sp. DT116]
MTTLVIGAGAAGAAAAHVCLDAVVCEADEAVGGRMESRERGDMVYDIGTTCLPDTGDERSTVAREVLGEDCRSFEARVAPAAARPDGGARPTRNHLTGRHGLGELPRRMLSAAHCDLRTGTTVRRLEPAADAWRAHTDDGLVTVERVVTTAGPARTADLLPDGPLADDLDAAAARLERRTLDSVVLGYDHAVEGDWDMLEPGADGAGLVRRVVRESAKPGHVPDGREALVVRLGDDWTATDGTDTATDRARRAVADRLEDDRLAAPAWTDHERYRYADPHHHADPGLVRAAADEGLHLAGGWVAGTTRTVAPLETGLDAGRRAMGFARQAAVGPDGGAELAVEGRIGE